MPIYTPALDLILNLADKSAAGRLALSGSQVVSSPSARAAVHRIVRGDTGLSRVRLVTPNLAGERAFNDVDLSIATVRIALGKPGENPYCLATLATPFPSAASVISAVQSATGDLPATKRITIDPPPYAGTWLLTLDSLAPIELPWDATEDQIQALAGSAYSVRRRAANAWEISGTEPGQDLTIAVDVSGLLVPVGLAGEIALNTDTLAAAFAAAASGTPPAEPRWLRLTLEVDIDGVKVYQNDQVEIAREIINLSATIPTPLPPSDLATVNAALATKQPLSSELVALAALTGSAFGRALLTKDTGPKILDYISAQPLNSQLTALAAVVAAAYGRSLLTASNPPAAKTLLLLDQVDNTADADKPISAAAQAALDLKAADSAVVHNTGPETILGVKTFASPPVVPSASFVQSAVQNLVADLAAKAALASPALTGTPTAPTPANVISSTQLATTAFVHALIADLLNAPPSTLDTLKELADALGDDPNFATTVAASIATKLAQASNLADLTDAAAARGNLALGNVNNTSDANKPVSTAQAAADLIISNALAAHAALTTNPHAVTKAQVGLGSADNTPDTAKPVSTPQQTALDLKANLAGANAFTGANSFRSLSSNSIVGTVLDNPGAPTVTPIGSDEGVTRPYKITAVLADGSETAAGPAGTSTHCDATLDATNRVSLAWTTAAGAVSYNVYRLANNGTSPATIGKIANVLTNAYVDTGAAGDGSTPPTTNGTGHVSGAIWDKGGQFFNVRAHGAKGNGIDDDTTFVQAALAAALGSGDKAGVLKFPAGRFKITGVLSVSDNKPLVIAGEGLASDIIWAGTGHLFHWSVSADQVTFQDLSITLGHAANATHTVFDLAGGATQGTSFRNVRVQYDAGSLTVGTVIDMGGLCDSVFVSQCHFSSISGTGIIAHGTSGAPGSSLFISDSRFIGTFDTDTSRGIDLQGKIGGVYVTGVDVIGFGTALDIRDNGIGATNREIFLTNVSLDSSTIGLNVQDSSYVSWVGVWAASCKTANILVGSNNPTLVFNGGTICNAGANGLVGVTPAHGFIINSGRVKLIGVFVRNNANVVNPSGLGIHVVAANSYSLSGCTVHDNYRGIAEENTSSAKSSVVGNIFQDNTAANLRNGTGATFVWKSNAYSGYGNEGETDNPPWIAPSLLNTWVNFVTGGQQVAGYVKEDGWVTCKGLLKNGTNVVDTILFLLPSGYRSTAIQYFEVSANSASAASIRVEPDGNVRIDRPATTNAALSLDGIRFRTN